MGHLATRAPTRQRQRAHGRRGAPLPGGPRCVGRRQRRLEGKAALPCGRPRWRIACARLVRATNHPPDGGVMPCAVLARDVATGSQGAGDVAEGDAPMMQLTGHCYRFSFAWLGYQAAILAHTVAVRGRPARVKSSSLHPGHRSRGKPCMAGPCGPLQPVRLRMAGMAQRHRLRAPETARDNVMVMVRRGLALEARPHAPTSSAPTSSLDRSTPYQAMAAASAMPSWGRFRRVPGKRSS